MSGLYCMFCVSRLEAVERNITRASRTVLSGDACRSLLDNLQQLIEEFRKGRDGVAGDHF